MILRLEWPLWLTLVVFGALLAVTLWSWWRSRAEGRGPAWLRRSAMVLCAAVIALAPAVPAVTRQVETTMEVYFVVDRTGSMAAEDYAEGLPRLEGVRHDVDALVTATAGARYSIIAFDSTATRQLPLTTDARAVRTWAETLEQEITAYSAGSSVDRPLPALTETLTAARERNPGNVRVLFFLSDGENTRQADQERVEGAWADLAPMVDAGAVLGYGTPEGGKMRRYDGTEATGAGTDAPYITDETQPGSPPAVSRIDETNLRRIAADLGIPYVHRLGPDPVDSLVEGIDVEEASGERRTEVVAYRDVWWPLAILLAGLFAWEAYVQAAALARLRGEHR